MRRESVGPSSGGCGRAVKTEQNVSRETSGPFARPGGQVAAVTRERGEGPCGPRSDAELLETIRRDLSAIYADVLQQPLPSHIADLIQRLEREAVT